ncbi:hypothetical protein N7532_010551 [Penicillium argentinense]|uniref:Uncharacterized protein n=1 Tax=Penicillium argentinense TaxID=1131581 RepID=A0A9W9EQ21_9EURO|nr:uncharacterized protein N7532_010551 [Penicillium argentinense]KAJ5085780.1 hypothetical protein N7532_010551 [Penicillium argentinense]
MSDDQQILAAKELGMVFNYMNEDVIWDKFCDTYEAMRDLLGDFQAFYRSNPSPNLPQANLPDLQKEWENFIHASLEQIVHNGRVSFDSMRDNKYVDVVAKFASWF